MSRTGFYTHPDCQRHDMGRGHPECPERLSAIRDRLLTTGVDHGLVEHEAPLAQEEDLLLAHDPHLVEAVSQLNREIQNEAAQGGHALMHIDPDTAMCEHSYNAAMRAVGARVDSERLGRLTDPRRADSDRFFGACGNHPPVRVGDTPVWCV